MNRQQAGDFDRRARRLQSAIRRVVTEFTAIYHMPPTTGEIAARLRYRPQYVRVLISRLVAAGMLRRERGGLVVVGDEP